MLVLLTNMLTNLGTYKFDLQLLYFPTKRLAQLTKSVLTTKEGHQRGVAALWPQL